MCEYFHVSVLRFERHFITFFGRRLVISDAAAKSSRKITKVGEMTVVSWCRN
jgi:hypothetical protein